MEELQKIKHQFAQRHTFAELQGMVTTVDYTLSHFYIVTKRSSNRRRPFGKTAMND